MRIGSMNFSTHAAGMSALWHDADYIPEKHLQTPTVEKGLAEMPLPSEQHQLPPGVSDPFAKLDQIYDVAGEQMERGLEGQAFLHGKRAPAEARGGADLGARPDDLTRTMVLSQKATETPSARAAEEARAQKEQVQKAAEAGTAPLKTSNATSPANARRHAERAEKALELAEGLGVSLAAMAVGQAIDPSGGVAGGAMADGASVVKAVSTAKTAVGLTRSMDDDGPSLRRGLAGAAPRSHQPSLDPGDAGHQPSLKPSGEE